jgi:opacity protein-like surface antigen
MRKFLKAAALAAVLLPAAASAQFTVGARVGYGIPGGTAFDELDAATIGSGKIEMKDFVDYVWVIPQIDVGFKLTKNFTLGAYYSYGMGHVKGSFADQFSDTSASNQRVGVQALWSFAPGQPIDLWIGAATGWEWFSFEGTNALAGGKVKATLNGWEFLTAQAGVDFNLGKSFAIGPYASYGWGQYSSYKFDVAALGSQSGSIQSKATHQLFQVGAKAAFNF